jgi:hypothetical protein
MKDNLKFSVNSEYKDLTVRVESLTAETQCLISTIIFHLKDNRKKVDEILNQVHDVFYNRLKLLEKEFKKELSLFNDFIVIVDVPEILNSKKKEGSYCEVSLYLKTDKPFEFNRKIADAVPQYKEAVLATEYFCEHILECIEDVEINYGVSFTKRKLKKNLLS